MKKIRIFLSKAFLKLSKMLAPSLSSKYEENKIDFFNPREIHTSKAKNNGSKIFFPFVDLAEHPAFKPYLPHTPLPLNQQEHFDRMQAHLDQLIEFIRYRNLSPRALQLWGEETIESCKKMHDLYLSVTSEYLPRLFFTRTLSQLQGQVLYNGYISNTAAAECEQPAVANSRLAELQNQGASVYQLPANLKVKLIEASRSYYDLLQKRTVNGISGRTVCGITPGDPLDNAIRSLVVELDMEKLFSEYLGTEIKYWGIGLELTTEKHDWWRNCYADDGIAQSPASYLHIDHGDFSPKNMLYLTPVNHQQGPTKFIKGSPKWKRSEFRQQFHKALDRISAQWVYGLVDNGHYRPLYQLPEFRKILMQFPRSFAGSSHLGDDLLEGTAECTLVLENEMVLLSDAGDLIAFDGGRGLHRGSTVMQGERLAAQLIYMPGRHIEANEFASKLLGRKFDITD